MFLMLIMVAFEQMVKFDPVWIKLMSLHVDEDKVLVDMAASTPHAKLSGNRSQKYYQLVLKNILILPF